MNRIKFYGGNIDQYTPSRKENFKQRRKQLGKDISLTGLFFFSVNPLGTLTKEYWLFREGNYYLYYSYFENSNVDTDGEVIEMNWDINDFPL